MGNAQNHEQQVDQKKIGFPYSKNPIWKMVREGQTNNLLKQFQNGNADCYQIVEESSAHTIVHEAITLDRRQLFRLCEVYGADWNQPDANGVTPLMKAAALNRTFYIEKLIELGVQVEKTDHRGRSAVDYARMYQNHQTADRLQQALPK